jgi:hypothetical protein
MKNIHILPTDKPSRLIFDKEEVRFLPLQDYPILMDNQDLVENQHIYITSDEEIKDVRLHKGKWQLEQEQILNKFPTYLTDLSECKLVIMTTDQDLIKNGIQPIDNEFLEWFVKNPSCEEVKVELFPKFSNNLYGIIIPKEEPKQDLEKEMFELEQELDIPSSMRWHNSKPKQETLEEASLRIGLMEIELNHTKTLLASCEKALENRDNQAKRMYSEEEVKQIIEATLIEYSDYVLADIPEWLEQFKKK